MEANVNIIGIVVFLALALIVYLVYRNQKDKKKVEQHFNDKANDFPGRESELNDER